MVHKLYLCVCVCVCVRAYVCLCVCVCVIEVDSTYTNLSLSKLQVAEQLMTIAYESGVNLFDTAEVYAAGRWVRVRHNDL